MSVATEWNPRWMQRSILPASSQDRWTPGILLALLLAGLAILPGCQKADPMNKKEGGLIVNGYNHTDDSLVFSVDGQAGALVFPHSSGGGACCLAIYKQWRPGMTVNISWSHGKDNIQHERAVPVPEYGDSIGLFNVHFLRGGEIKVFATLYDLGHEKYPLKGPEAGLWEPGKSPREIWNMAEGGSLDDKVRGFTAWFVYNGGSFAVDKPGFEAFVRRQLQAAQAYGISDWRSQDEFVNMAMFTNGEFVNYPMIREWLARQDRTQTFQEFAATIPKEMYDHYSLFQGTDAATREEAK